MGGDSCQRCSEQVKAKSMNGQHTTEVSEKCTIKGKTWPSDQEGETMVSTLLFQLSPKYHPADYISLEDCCQIKKRCGQVFGSWCH